MKKYLVPVLCAVLLVIPSIAFSAPPPAWVSDGPGGDVDFWASATSVEANWASVTFSGTATDTRYEWAITTSPFSGDSPIPNGTGFTDLTSIATTGLSMTEGTSYYVHVRSGELIGADWQNSSFTASDGFQVDLTGPSASLGPLDGVQAQNTFTVSWSATDALSGVESYDVQFRQNNGGWTDWLIETTAESAEFLGANGATFRFRVRGRDVAGNVGSYSTEIVTVVNSMAAHLNVAAVPSTLSFAPGETATQVTLNIIGGGASSFSLTSLSESRTYAGWPVENLPDEPLSQSINAGIAFPLNVAVDLSAAQRAKALSTSAGGVFTLNYVVRGMSVQGDPVEAPVAIPVQVNEGLPSSLTVATVSVNLPADPYYLGDQVYGEILIAAAGTGTVEGQILVDGSATWTQNASFTATISGTTVVPIAEPLPTATLGVHQITVELTTPDSLTSQTSYSVADANASPFDPSRIALIPQVAEIANLNGNVIAQAGPGYEDFIFTGTAALDLLTAGPVTVPDAAATSLVIRYYDGDPVPHPIGGTVEVAAATSDPAPLFELASGFLKVRKVAFQASADPANPQDVVNIDAVVNWADAGGELMELAGIPVGINGIEATALSLSPGNAEFTAFGKTFHIEDTAILPAVQIVPEANRIGLLMAGRLSWPVKYGASLPINEEITQFEDFLLYSDGTAQGAFPASGYSIMGGKAAVQNVSVEAQPGNAVCLVEGVVTNLPEPLEMVSQPFSIGFEIDGSLQGQPAGLDEFSAGTQGLQGESADPTEWEYDAATVDLTYATPSLYFGAGGVLHADQSQIHIAIDVYLNLRSGGGPLPPEQSRISFGSPGPQGTVIDAVEIDAAGTVSWPTPETGSAFDDTRYDFTSILTLDLDHLEVSTDQGFAFRTAGTIVVDFPGVDGGATFQDLRLSLDGGLEKGTAEQIEGDFDMLDVVQITVGDINWGGNDTLSFASDTSEGESQGSGPDTKSVEVSQWLRLEGAEIQLGDTGKKGEALLGGTFDALTIFQPVDGNKSFVLQNVEANLYYIKLMQTDIEFLSTYLNLSGKVKIIPNDIIATVVGTAGVRNGKPSFGLFVAAANLQMQVYPSVYLDEIGGGFFLNPDTDILQTVKTLAGFDTSGPTLVDSVDALFPPGANEPGSFALLLMGGMYVVDKKIVQGRALFQLTENNFSIDAEVNCLKKILQGEAHLAIGWDPGYAYGLVDVELDVLKLLQGDGELQFYIFDASTWGISGAFNISLLWSVKASGEIFLGPPGFLLSAENEISVDLGIVSGGVGLDAMFWYHNRQGEEDSWGAYAQARIWGEILWGLLSGEASLEGALIGAPRFTIYTVGTLRVEICWVEVFSGSLWVAIGEDGIDGGKGRNSQYDQLIEDAKNMADEMNQAMDELLDEIDAARLAMAELSETQREAAGLALVERSGLVGGLVNLVFNYNEIDNWGGAASLPPQLDAIYQQIFGPGQTGLEQARSELQSEQATIDAALSALDDLENQVVTLMASYQHLLVDDLPSVQEMGVSGDPFRGMETAVVQVGENTMTVPIGFRIDESQAESQADGLEQLREDFSEYQMAFIERAGLIDATLQELDEVLFSGAVNLSALNETYADIQERMGLYVERFVRFQQDNGEYAEESLALFDAPGMETTVQNILYQKANQLSATQISSWNNDRDALTTALIAVGGEESAQVQTGSSTLTDVETFVGRGNELWYEIPRAGFTASRDQSPVRANQAIFAFNASQVAFRERWSSSTELADTVFSRKSDLYDLLWEIYDQLARYGSGMIAVTGSGEATGFPARIQQGLGFRGTEPLAQVQSQIYVLPQNAIPPQTPIVGPYNPVLPVGDDGQHNIGMNLILENQGQIIAEILVSYLEEGQELYTEYLAAERPRLFGRGKTQTPETPSRAAEPAPAISETWIPIRSYFSSKRTELEPYIEIPLLADFDGDIFSEHQSGAFLTATITGSHPIGISEYAYRLSNVPIEDFTPVENQGQTSLAFVGPQPDWAHPWVSLGRIGEISRVFFSEPGANPLYLTMRIRGAGGKSIVFRTPFTVELFNPATDSGPVGSAIDATDNTPPQQPVVSLSGPFTASQELIYAAWSASDPESGIGKYEYGVSLYTGPPPGSSPGSTSTAYQAGTESLSDILDVPLMGAIQYSTTQPAPRQPAPELEPDMLDWVDAGGRTEGNIRGLSMVDGERYVVHVRATNGLGMTSIGTSPPILVDLSPPVPPTVTSINQVVAEGLPNSVAVAFTGGSDAESGIAGHRFALGTEPDSENLWPWTETQVGTVTVADLPVMSGTTVYASIQATNGAGLTSTGSSSAVISYTDSTPPSAPYVSSDPALFASEITELTASWDRISDGESGVIGYQYGVGTTPADADVVGWQSIDATDPYVVGTQTTVTESSSRVKTGSSGFIFGGSASTKSKGRPENVTDTDFNEIIDEPPLQNGVQYYVLVKATNGTGLQSTGASPPLVIDATPPEQVTLTGQQNQPDGDTLAVELYARDVESGIAGYRYAVWKLDGVSEIDGFDPLFIPTAGIVKKGKLKGTYADPGQQYSPPTGSTELPGVVSQGQGALPQQSQEQLGPSANIPWASFDPTELLPPWFESAWVDLQIPSEEIDIDVVITGYPAKGLRAGDRIIVKIWAMNGAGLFAEGDTLTITIDEPDSRTKKTTPSIGGDRL